MSSVIAASCWSTVTACSAPPGAARTLWLANCYFAHFPQDPKLNVTLLQCAQKLPEDQFARDTSSTLFLSPTYGGLTSWYPGFVRLGDDWQRVAIVRVMCSIYALSDRQFYRPRFLAVD